MPTPGTNFLAQLGSSFGAYGLRQQNQQQAEQFRNKTYIAEKALQMIDERAQAGDTQFLNDPDLGKHLKSFIGPQTMEALLPFKQKEAEAVSNQNQLKSNIMKFAAALGQSQQAGTKLAPNAIPTLISSGATAGIKPADLTAAGLQIKPSQPKAPADLDALAQARGYGSYSDTPQKLKQQLFEDYKKSGRETAQEAADKATAVEGAKNKVNQPAETAAQPLKPGTLPTVLDYNQFRTQNPSLSEKQMPVLFKAEQDKYKKQVTDIRGIDSAKNNALRIRENILKFMDENKMDTPDSGMVGKLGTTGYSKLTGEFPNLAPKKYQQLYTMLSQLRAAAMPAYLAKGGPRAKSYLDQMTKHLPNATDNPGFIREQIGALGPFIDSVQEQNRQSIAQDFGIDYTAAPSPATEIKDGLEKYRKPDGSYDTDAIARDPSLK